MSFMLQMVMVSVGGGGVGWIDGGGGEKVAIDELVKEGSQSMERHGVHIGLNVY